MTNVKPSSLDLVERVECRVEVWFFEMLAACEAFWNEWGFAVKKTIKACSAFLALFALLAFCVIHVMLIWPNQ